MGEELTAMLAATRTRWPHLRFAVQGAGQRRLLQYLKQDELDIVVALVPDEPEGAARHYWTEELAWVRGKTTTLDLTAPGSAGRLQGSLHLSRVALATLAKAGIAGELVFRAQYRRGAAQRRYRRCRCHAGAAEPHPGRTRRPGMTGRCRRRPPVYGGVFVREGAANDTLDQLADRFAETLRPAAARSRCRGVRRQRVPPAQGARHSA